MSPHCIIVMNQAFYQSRRNLGRICEAEKLADRRYQWRRHDACSRRAMIHM